MTMHRIHTLKDCLRKSTKPDNPGTELLWSRFTHSRLEAGPRATQYIACITRKVAK